MANVAWPEKGKRNIIGSRIPRQDGPEKTTGEAKYSYDINRPGMLWGKLVTSPKAYAELVAVDTSVASSLPGVKAVWIDEDLIGDTVALIDPSAGGFQELGRFEAEWEEDETHTLGLEVIGSAITAYADGLPIISATDDDSMTSTFVGIFSRGDGGNKVQDFVVNSAP